MDFTAVLRARRLLAGTLPPTPMWSYPVLDRLTGATVFVKHDNVQPTGSFKVRGGLNLMSTIDDPGVVTYSTGNHALSIAYAARAHGRRCILVMPEGANPAKVRAAEALDAQIVLKGADLSAAAEHAAELAAVERLRLVTPAGDPALLAGVATAYLEILTAEPDLDAIVVPVGSGTGAAAACVVAAAIAPHCRIIAVQSAASPAAHDSWRAGSCVQRPNTTAVEGLATGRGFELPQSLMRDRLADCLLVPDEQSAGGRRPRAGDVHTRADGAGGAALAAVLAHRGRFAGLRIAVMCSGGNAGPAELADLAP
jgi:threonine dehydratase